MSLVFDALLRAKAPLPAVYDEGHSVTEPPPPQPTPEPTPAPTPEPTPTPTPEPTPAPTSAPGTVGPIPPTGVPVVVAANTLSPGLVATMIVLAVLGGYGLAQLHRQFTEPLTAPLTAPLTEPLTEPKNVPPEAAVTLPLAQLPEALRPLPPTPPASEAETASPPAAMPAATPPSPPPNAVPAPSAPATPRTEVAPAAPRPAAVTQPPAPRPAATPRPPAKPVEEAAKPAEAPPVPEPPLKGWKGISNVRDTVLAFNDAMARNDLAEARRIVEQGLVSHGEQNLSISRLQAYLLLHEGKAEEARRIYRNIVARMENDLEANLNLALLDARMGAMSAATERLERMRALHPDNARVRQALERLSNVP